MSHEMCSNAFPMKLITIKELLVARRKSPPSDPSSSTAFVVCGRERRRRVMLTNARLKEAYASRVVEPFCIGIDFFVAHLYSRLGSNTWLAS